MLKKICSVALAMMMLLSAACMAFAGYVPIEGFEDGNTSAKEIEIYDKYAFVVAGDEADKPDAINVYNLATKELIQTLALPVYTTGKDYFAENIEVVGDQLLVSWNRHIGSGDPSIRKYAISDLIEGKLETVDSFGVRDNKVTLLYKDKFFLTNPYNIVLQIANPETLARETVMTLPTKDVIKNIITLATGESYFYFVRANEIMAFDATNINQGIVHNYIDTAAIYKTDVTITDAMVHNDKLFVTTEQGLEIFTVENGQFKSLGKYTQGGNIMAMKPADNTLYVYADGAKAIQILDISDVANIKVKEEIKVKNSATLGVKDIAIDGNRIYAADLTEGFTMYSANELDSLVQEEEIKAESYAQELSLSPQRKAIELVVGLKIMNLRDNGLFGPSLYITRGEFAQSVSNLVGANKNGAHGIIEFTDVPADYQYREGINALVNLGILNGYGDGTFRPEDPILYEHAVKIMVKLLGYYPMKGNNNSCITIASDIGILDNVSPMANGYISRGNVARLIYNSLETERMEISANGNPAIYNISTEDTLLAQMGIKKAKGQVTATEFTSILGSKAASKNKVIIGGVQYPEGESGASSYLGRYITYWYVSDEDTENGEILFLIPMHNDDVLTIDAKDIADSTTVNEIAYYDEEYNTEKENIKNATIIYNGKFLANPTAKDLNPDDGELTLIDSDNDGTFDVVIVRSYETFIVEGYSSGLFKFKYGHSDINLNSKLLNAEKMIIELDGDRYTESMLNAITIKEWYVVSIVRSYDEKIVEVYVSSRIVSGMATQRNGKKVKIGEEEFELSQSYLDNVATGKDVPDFVVGNEYYAYIDKFGKIATVGVNDNSPIYGYLVAADKGDGLNSHIAEFRILVRDQDDPKGVIKNFYSSEKLKVNGKLTEDITAVSHLFEEGKAKKQIVKFKLDLDGNIKEMYTAINKVDSEIDGMANPDYEENYVGYTEGQFTYDAKVKSGTGFRGGHQKGFDGCKFVPNVNTLVFKAVHAAEPRDEDYIIYAPDQVFKSGNTVQGTVYMFDTDEDYNVAAILLDIGTGVETRTVEDVKKYAIIDEFRVGLNDEGDETYTLISAKNAKGKTTEIVIKDKDLTDDQADSTTYKGMRLLDLPRGSVIRYVTNVRDEITGIRIMHVPTVDKNGDYIHSYYEYDKNGYKKTTMPDSSFAKIIKRTSGNRLLYNAEGVRLAGGSLEEADRTWDRNMGAGSATVYIYDKETDKVSSGTLSDILPGDDALVVTRSVYLDLIVIYR